MLEHLSKHNVPIALATSSTKESYELKTNKHHKEIFSLFQIKTFGSSDPEVKFGKPHPDIFLITANRFPDKPKPEQVLQLNFIQVVTKSLSKQVGINSILRC